jgi:hypothetical protein
MSVFNIEVLNTYQMPFWMSKKFSFLGGVGGHFTKMCAAKFSPFMAKASAKIACHKMEGLQFARNAVGLQYWHSI